MWGVFRRFAPSANLPSEYGNLKTDKPYPFAVKVDVPVTVQTGLSVLRDWYEGTNYR
jgi:dipeptidase